MTAISRIRLVTLGIAALVIAGAAVAPACANERYVFEFRARSGGYFGHTYVAYGPIDAHGRLMHARYAGFYPSGILTDTVFLAVLAAPGHVNLEPRDRAMRSDLVYRREIDARTYSRLPYEIQMLSQSRPLWHLTFCNCNGFAADVAESLGMRVPPTLQVPSDFVRGLYQLNRRTPAGVVYADASVTYRKSAHADELFWRVIGGGARPR